MKKVFLLASLMLLGIVNYACAGSQKSDNAEAKDDGGVVVLNKEKFKTDIFDYENATEWSYKGDKPAIIDLYADWCGPCRKVAPIMKELAKDYEGKIIIYKVNVDKEKELASLFNARSIPLFVFIPVDGEPQFLNGAADKDTYKKIIDEFLLANK